MRKEILVHLHKADRKIQLYPEALHKAELKDMRHFMSAEAF